MNIDEWWPKLDPSAQQWLIANNGDAVSAGVLAQIAAAGGDVTPDSRWVGESDEGGFFLSDEETDWIEALATPVFVADLAHGASVDERWRDFPPGPSVEA
ncbi:MAG: hypothetical protein V4531_07595 [Actinomycetota bacterium]